jgi:hypothetical protein
MLTAEMFYQHAQIAGVIDRTKPFRALFLEHFGQEYLSQTDKIIFEEISPDERIAPFVRPMVQAEAATTRGHEVMAFAPAYMKPKDVIMPKTVTRRRVGEPLMGSMTPSQRYQAELLSKGLEQRNRIFRAKEKMARDLFRSGKYIVEGDNYPAQEIDFKRKASFTGPVPVADKWDKVAADSNPSSPVEQLEEWILEMEKPVRRIIMGKDAAKWFKKDPALKDRLDTRFRGNSTDMTLDFVQMEEDQTVLLGYLGAMRIPVIMTTATFEVEKRTTSGVVFQSEQYVDDNEVYLLPSADHGHRCYGIIQDAEAEFQAMSHFYKNWVDKDPAVPQIMTQSSPLLVHTWINATRCHQVC